jgi:hypothetical protein
MISSYERISIKLLAHQPKAKQRAFYHDGKYLSGTKSLHLTPASRMWRMFWRIKSVGR